MSIKAPSDATLRQKLGQLSRMTGTLPGLDATLMVAQYTSPLVVALLLKIAKLRTEVRVNPAAVGGSKVSSLVEIAAGWARVGGSIGDARVIMRAAGLLPMIQWLLALHPHPLQALKSLLTFNTSVSLSSPKTLPTLQVLSLLCYYPLEHIAWLASKGVVRISPQATGKAALWSVRFWALYVMLAIYGLKNTYGSLLHRTHAMRNSKPAVSAPEAEGYELTEGKEGKEGKEGAFTVPPIELQGQQVKALMTDWRDWKTSVMVNAGYAPLTLHWSTPGGLWTSPFLTSIFGTVAAVGQFTVQWRKAA